MSLSIVQCVVFTYFFSLNVISPTLNDVFCSVNSKSNTLYLGIDNIVHIPERFQKKDQYIITTDNGILSYDSAGLIIIPRRLPDLHIDVIKLNGPDSVLIKRERFFTNYVPKPCVTLAARCINEYEKIDRNFLISNPKLGIFISNDINGAENWVKINRITMGFLFSSVYKSYETEGDELSEEMKKILSYLRPGQEIDIMVSVVSIDNMTRYLPVYKLTIY